MAQQTSVEWLVSHFNKQEWFTFKQKEYIEQAKEMHKEEIMDAFQAGKWDWSTHINHGKNSMDPEEYYNETFNK
jgi:hypothetical protein